jgi:hypothetical protein
MKSHSDRQMGRWTDRQISRQGERQTGRQTDGQWTDAYTHRKDRQMKRWNLNKRTNRQTDRHKW